MFDWIEIENLDPRLITVSAAGKVEVSLFPETITVHNFSTREDIAEEAIGDIVFANSDAHLQITSTGSFILFATNFVPQKVRHIWADNLYFQEAIKLQSTVGFTVSSSGNSISFSPNSVHSINGLNGDLTVDSDGDLTYFTDTSQGSISLSIRSVTEGSIDATSAIDTLRVIANEGLSLGGILQPTFTHLEPSGPYISVQGITGNVIEKPQFTQLICESLSFTGTDIFDNSGQIRVQNALVSISGDILQSDIKPAISYSIEPTGYTFSSGVYTHTFEHLQGLRPLCATVDFQGSQAGLGRSFSGVLSYSEQQTYIQSIPSLTSGIQSKYLSLMANPDNLTGTTLTTYQGLLADIMGDYLSFSYTASPYVALTGAIAQLAPPKSTTYMLLVTGGSLTATGSMPLLTGLVAGKATFQYTVDELEKPKVLAYFYEFTDDSFSLTLKCPTFYPPSGSVRILFEHA